MNSSSGIGNAARATGFRMPRLVLPRRGVDLAKWAVIACDQYTSEPEYWQRVGDRVGDAPSTLHLIFPEVHLGAPGAKARIAAIQQAMRRYLAEGLLEEREAGTVYVERMVDGRTRRGVMLELDLEHYDFSAESTSLIRPTEGTIVARLAPRIEVRREAALELPHVLVLIDDPKDSVIGPVAEAARRGQLAKRYETELMLNGGHLAGHAVGAAHGARVVQSLAALAQPEAFARRYGVPATTPPMLFAMGDGNHSLATAKVIWEQAKGSVGMDHPSRWALVEVENIHDAALHFAPIHRLLLGVKRDVRAALQASFGAKLTLTECGTAQAMRERLHALAQPDGKAGAERGAHRIAAGLIGPGAAFAVLEIADSPSALAVGALQPFIDRFIHEEGGAADIDYVHGADVLERLATQGGSGSAAPQNVGFHIGTVGKSELLERVVRDGPLPRKTFSMGEAHEKRFYFEARRIR